MIPVEVHSPVIMTESVLVSLDLNNNSINVKKEFKKILVLKLLIYPLFSYLYLDLLKH